MEGKLYTIEDAIKLIEQDKMLLIAADDSLLKKLPDGKWIGGSNPYMLDDVDGGKCSMDQLFIKDFTDVAVNMNIKTYDENDIHNITTDGYDNGLIITVLPIFTTVQQVFAVNAPTFENQFMDPLLGWVSGATLETTAPGVATTYAGNKCYNDKGVVMHIELPEDKIGRLEIISVLERDESTDEITFEQDGFSNTTCRVNGEEKNLYDYLVSIDFKWTLPLIANYAGAKINVGVVQDIENKMVHFGAPVFKDTVYKVVTNVTDDYSKTFFAALDKDKDSDIAYSISCIYNYINFGLDGKTIPGTRAPFTWGEIAYQLLNDTHVYLVIEDK